MNLEGIKRFLTGSKAKDGFRFSPTHPLARQHELLSALLAEALPKGQGPWWYFDPKTSKVAKVILDADREEQARIAAAAIEQATLLDEKAATFRAKAKGVHYESKDGWWEIWHPRMTLVEIVSTLVRKKLPFSQVELEAFAEWGSRQDSFFHFPAAGLVGAAENFTVDAKLSPLLAERLDKVLLIQQERLYDAADRKLAQRLLTLLGKAPKLPIDGTDVWSAQAMADLQAMPTDLQTVWCELLHQCAQADSAKPPAKWLKELRQLIEKQIGVEAFQSEVARWFPLVDKPRPPEMPSGRNFQVPPFWIHDTHANVLKGLAWCCEITPSADILRLLTALALSCYRKVPGTGPRLTRVGNACIHTLGAIGGLDAIGQLAILRVRVKFGTAQAMLEKALNVTAEKAGLPREELEEMSVPTYGLTEVGSFTAELGDATARLCVAGNRNVEIHWSNAAGKPMKSVPAAVKKDWAEDIKELKQAQKDIEQMLGAQAERLDQLFLQQKSWPLETWRERYLDHPLVGVLARRLVWKFINPESATLGLWGGEHLNDVAGEPVPLSNETRVALWHPIDSLAEVVQQWRQRIESLEVRQPFKQAHREIYLLTPAEETTGTYSNRFASHVLKQHQFNALCAQRGWKNKLRLMVDNTYPPASRFLQNWNLRAEFWIDGMGSGYGTDTNEVGVYLYISTDQVRFYPMTAPERTAQVGTGGYRVRPGQDDIPIPLAEVPPLVFSEIMRDVDLFVGVCSVGNDPTWNDGGPQGRFRDYWQDFSFGVLSGTATTRRDILQRLVPRLKIAPLCSFLDRFLVVKGSLHDYKIHLGSGNILMSPNDRYLCIVARQSATAAKQEFFLPFEGDQLLSVIISKAFLLANDAKITDPSILQQIK